jgi:hypothetical protein
LDHLATTSQGRLVTQAAADDLLLRLHGEAVDRMLADMEPWGEDEDLRESVVELLARHVLAEARASFVRRVLVGMRN